MPGSHITYILAKILAGILVFLYQNSDHKLNQISIEHIKIHRKYSKIKSVFLVCCVTVFNKNINGGQ